MNITFLGHREIGGDAELRERILGVLLPLVAAGEEVCFFFGGYGAFDGLCAEVCRGMRREHGNIRMIYVTPYVTPSAQREMRYLLKEGFFDETVYPPLETVPPRFAIVRRNEWMVLQADLVLAYVARPFGGAYGGLCYARRKKKRVINLALEGEGGGKKGLWEEF